MKGFTLAKDHFSVRIATNLLKHQLTELGMKKFIIEKNLLFARYVRNPTADYHI